MATHPHLKWSPKSPHRPTRHCMISSASSSNSSFHLQRPFHCKANELKLEGCLLVRPFQGPVPHFGCILLIVLLEDNPSLQIQALKYLDPALPSHLPSLILALPYWCPWNSPKKLRMLPLQGLAFCCFFVWNALPQSSWSQGPISSPTSECCATSSQ